MARLGTTLDVAVEAGSISAEAACCGLLPDDVAALVGDGFGYLDIVAIGHTGRRRLSVARFADEGAAAVGASIGGLRYVAAVAI